MNKPSSSTNREEVHHGFWERQAVRMARWPKTHFWIAFIASLSLSVIGMLVGDFTVSVEGSGWQSRGTLIADRQTQVLFTAIKGEELFSSGDQIWDDFMNNVQPGWETDDDAVDRQTESRKLREIASKKALSSLTKESLFTPKPGPQLVLNDHLKNQHHRMAVQAKTYLTRRLHEEQAQEGVLSGCDVEWYTDGRMISNTRLWPVWETKHETDTFLDPSLLQELCQEEEITQQLLEEHGLCFGCSVDEKCLPPFSIVLYARLVVPGGTSMDCATLAKAWTPYQAATEEDWKTCIQDLESGSSGLDDEGLPLSCPNTFNPSFVDGLFLNSGNVRYTSSIFATNWTMVDDLYAIADRFGKGDQWIEGVYDTQDENFVNLLADESVGMDMVLALGSAFITAIAILVHTKSPFLTVVGLVQIMLSFPLAYFAYTTLGGINFFPFLNFIGVFVVFALGADHIFVSVDKWKNARIKSPHATTEEVAAAALPDAAGAMLLTTTTTAVAFFGTAICPVAPVKLFAIFCGLLILFDYIMDILLVFPALCMFDRSRGKSGCCMSWQKSHRTNPETEQQDEPQDLDVESPETGHNNNNNQENPPSTSFIRRILISYYTVLHRFRWILLIASITALIVCSYYASTLRLPTSSDVRIFRSNIEPERNYLWRQNLLFNTLEKKDGSTAHVIWGTKAADTGDHNDPATWSKLVLDDSFDPSTEQGQSYLRDFCPRFFENDFASFSKPGFECAMNKFDRWIQQQSNSVIPDPSFSTHCAKATALPIPTEIFHPCIIAWATQEHETSILSYEGKVKIVSFPFSSRVRYDSPNSVLEEEWNLIENWMDHDSEEAPREVSNRYFSSNDFWWYDTNSQMFKTAIGSAGIAILAAALIILISSRSIVMTIFSIMSVGYVLTSVTATMVSIGWTLGFLESICFAILIGVSVDFVIHFSHAYVTPQGSVDRAIRTKHALIEMGPSILAAAFTTIAGATIMLFTLITFFQKFALVLFLTIIQATLGSFVFFLTLTDCLGPAEPTYLADRLIGKLAQIQNNDDNNKNNNNSPNDEDDEHDDLAKTERSNNM